MKRNSFFSFFVLVFFALLLSCGSGDPGSPGSDGSGETGCMPIIESVAPTNTFLTTGNLTSAESVEVTIGEYDLPNREGTCSGMTFTKYTVEYKPLEPGCPFLDNRYYTGTWYVEPNTNATFNLTFWDFSSYLSVHGCFHHGWLQRFREETNSYFPIRSNNQEIAFTPTPPFSPFKKPPIRGLFALINICHLD
ncbi:MAG: hypothetical protein JRJ48_00685 [Deltaproteobacteria bacterium]|nr:hypothetical protein [Deltaproteobacteria bacterium]